MLQVKKLTSFDDLKDFDFSSVGFFQTPEYYKILIKHFCKEEKVILLGVYDENEIVGCGAFENVDGVIKFLGMKKVLGGQEVTDYGDIVINYELKITPQNLQSKLAGQANYELFEKLYKEVWEKVLEWFKENGSKKIELDYLKNELKIQNYELRIEEQEIAPYLDLPESFEKYVESLEYKNRRELRRKMNRLEKEVGNDHWSFRSTEGGKITRDDFQDFVRLVKLSENEKEKFMTGEMEEFFWDLVNIGRDKNNIVGVDLRVDPQKVADKPGGLSLQKDGWQPLLNFFTINNKNAACILTFENGTESLAYNSGYDPEFLFFSPGFLSQAFKIKQLIEKSYKKYDFLRGKERYKYDLGAKEEKLYKIIISV